MDRHEQTRNDVRDILAKHDQIDMAADAIVEYWKVGRASRTSNLVSDILAELVRARTKFPGDNVTTLAMVEEVGELAKATFSESRDAVRKEAIQVATMAMRIVLDGDATLNDWRASKGLDPLIEGEQR